MERLIKSVQKFCEIIELAASVLVSVGIVLSVISLLRDFEIFQHLLNDMSVFREYLEKIFFIVIGIEFVGMLCRPSSDNVLEVLIFLVARHMIVGDTSPYEDFVSVISIALLCVLRRYLHDTKDKHSVRKKAAQEEHIS